MKCNFLFSNVKNLLGALLLTILALSCNTLLPKNTCQHVKKDKRSLVMGIDNGAQKTEFTQYLMRLGYDDCELQKSFKKTGSVLIETYDTSTYYQNQILDVLFGCLDKCMKPGTPTSKFILKVSYCGLNGTYTLPISAQTIFAASELIYNMDTLILNKGFDMEPVYSQLANISASKNQNQIKIEYNNDSNSATITKLIPHNTSVDVIRGMFENINLVSKGEFMHTFAIVDKSKNDVIIRRKFLHEDSLSFIGFIFFNCNCHFDDQNQKRIELLMKKKPCNFIWPVPIASDLRDEFLSFNEIGRLSLQDLLTKNFKKFVFSDRGLGIYEFSNEYIKFDMQYSNCTSQVLQTTKHVTSLKNTENKSMQIRKDYLIKEEEVRNKIAQDNVNKQYSAYMDTCKNESFGIYTSHRNSGLLQEGDKLDSDESIIDKLKIIAANSLKRLQNLYAETSFGSREVVLPYKVETIYKNFIKQLMNDLKSFVNNPEFSVLDLEEIALDPDMKNLLEAYTKLYSMYEFYKLNNKEIENQFENLRRRWGCLDTDIDLIEKLTKNFKEEHASITELRNKKSQILENLTKFDKLINNPKYSLDELGGSMDNLKLNNKPHKNIGNEETRIDIEDACTKNKSVKEVIERALTTVKAEIEKLVKTQQLKARASKIGCSVHIDRNELKLQDFVLIIKSLQSWHETMQESKFLLQLFINEYPKIVLFKINRSFLYYLSRYPYACATIYAGIKNYKQYDEILFSFERTTNKEEEALKIVNKYIKGLKNEDFINYIKDLENEDFNNYIKDLENEDIELQSANKEYKDFKQSYYSLSKDYEDRCAAESPLHLITTDTIRKFIKGDTPYQIIKYPLLIAEEKFVDNRVKEIIDIEVNIIRKNKIEEKLSFINSKTIHRNPLIILEVLSAISKHTIEELQNIYELKSNVSDIFDFPKKIIDLNCSFETRENVDLNKSIRLAWPEYIGLLLTVAKIFREYLIMQIVACTKPNITEPKTYQECNEYADRLLAEGNEILYESDKNDDTYKKTYCSWFNYMCSKINKEEKTMGMLNGWFAYIANYKTDPTGESLVDVLIFLKHFETLKSLFYKNFTKELFNPHAKIKKIPPGKIELLPIHIQGQRIADATYELFTKNFDGQPIPYAIDRNIKYYAVHKNSIYSGYFGYESPSMNAVIDIKDYEDLLDTGFSKMCKQFEADANTTEFTIRYPILDYYDEYKKNLEKKIFFLSVRLQSLDEVIDIPNLNEKILTGKDLIDNATSIKKQYDIYKSNPGNQNIKLEDIEVFSMASRQIWHMIRYIRSFSLRSDLFIKNCPDQVRICFEIFKDFLKRIIDAEAGKKDIPYDQLILEMKAVNKLGNSELNNSELEIIYQPVKYVRNEKESIAKPGEATAYRYLNGYPIVKFELFDQFHPKPIEDYEALAMNRIPDNFCWKFEEHEDIVNYQENARNKIANEIADLQNSLGSQHIYLAIFNRGTLAIKDSIDQMNKNEAHRSGYRVQASIRDSHLLLLLHKTRCSEIAREMGHYKVYLKLRFTDRKHSDIGMKSEEIAKYRVPNILLPWNNELIVRECDTLSPVIKGSEKYYNLFAYDFIDDKKSDENENKEEEIKKQKEAIKKQNEIYMDKINNENKGEYFKNELYHTYILTEYDLRELISNQLYSKEAYIYYKDKQQENDRNVYLSLPVLSYNPNRRLNSAGCKYIETNKVGEMYIPNYSMAGYMENKLPACTKHVIYKLHKGEHCFLTDPFYLNLANRPHQLLYDHVKSLGLL